MAGTFIFRWWAKNNLIEGTCPNCGFQQTGIKQQKEFPCQSCGALLTIDQKSNSFLRARPSFEGGGMGGMGRGPTGGKKTPGGPGDTIDVDAEVTSIDD